MNQQQQGQINENQRLIDLCTQKLEKEPNHKKALLLRASTYIKMNQLELAESDANSILALDPNNSAAYFLLGCICEKRDQYEQSIQYLTSAIEMDPDNVKALFFRGAVYNTLGYFQKAIDDYDLALQQDSLRVGRKKVYKNIGKVLGVNNDGRREEGSYGGYDNENGSEIDKEINNYIYNQFKTLSIKNKNNAVMHEDNFNIIQNNQKEGGQGLQRKYIPNSTRVVNNFDNNNNEREVHEIIDPAEASKMKMKSGPNSIKGGVERFLNNNSIKSNSSNQINYTNKTFTGLKNTNNTNIIQDNTTANKSYQYATKQGGLQYNLNPQSPSNINMSNNMNPINNMSNYTSSYSTGKQNYQKNDSMMKPNSVINPKLNSSNLNNEVIQSNLLCSHEDFPDSEMPVSSTTQNNDSSSFHSPTVNRFQSDTKIATISHSVNPNKKYEKWEIS